MHTLLLTPRQALWVPRHAGLVRLARPRPTIIPPRWSRMPLSPDGLLWASGDTLGIFTSQMNQPPSSNYATFGVRNGHLVLEFDTTTQEQAIFAGRMPRNYAGGNIVVSVSWMAATATTGTIGWDVTFERDASGGDDMDADSFATAQTVTAATVNATSGKISVTTVTITAGAAGTDSTVAGDDFRLRVRRDVANDTAAGDAQLISVELKEA